MNSTNPYEAPTASIAPVGPIGKPSGHRSPWWSLRYLPVVFIGYFAVCFVSFAVIVALRLIWLLQANGGKFVALHPSDKNLFWAAPGFLIFGIFSFVAARSWYLSAWKRAMMLTILCSLISVLFFSIFGPT